MADYVLKAGLITLIFAIIKFIEMRIITKTNKPIKEMIRDVTITYISAIIGIYTYDILTPVIGHKVPDAFVGDPGF
tara:strand:- start:3392 stop:3619 length:228 start_codon:yes stop_codon:yes gene_type:complete